MSALPMRNRLIDLFTLLFHFLAEARLAWVEKGMLSKYHFITPFTFGVYVSLLLVESDSC